MGCLGGIPQLLRCATGGRLCYFGDFTISGPQNQGCMVVGRDGGRDADQISIVQGNAVNEFHEPIFVEDLNSQSGRFFAKWNRWQPVPPSTGRCIPTQSCGGDGSSAQECPAP